MWFCKKFISNDDELYRTTQRANAKAKEIVNILYFTQFLYKLVWKASRGNWRDGKSYF